MPTLAGTFHTQDSILQPISGDPWITEAARSGQDAVVTVTLRTGGRGRVCSLSPSPHSARPHHPFRG